MVETNSIHAFKEAENGAQMFTTMDLPLDTDLNVWTLVSCHINDNPVNIWEKFLSRSFNKDEIWLKQRYIKFKRKKGLTLNIYDKLFECLQEQEKLHITPIRYLIGDITFKRVQVIDIHKTHGGIGRLMIEQVDRS